MWIFDIYHNIYSYDCGRRISVVKCDGNENTHFCARAWELNNLTKSKPAKAKIFEHRSVPTTVYTLVEEWLTPQSQGATWGWNYYTFFTYQDAMLFVVDLAIKFNHWAENYLMRRADRVATFITEEYKTAAKKINAKEKQQREKQTQQNQYQKIKEELKTQRRKYVYIFSLENNTVKIGVSNNVNSRRHAIMNSSGLRINVWCHTEEAFSEGKALEIESTLHRLFSEHRTIGEFFKIPYETARKELKAYGRIVLAHDYDD